MYISLSKNTDGKRVHDKKNVCFYCDKEYADVVRHLKGVHKEERAIVEASCLKKGSKELQKAMEKIRLMGNFGHNLKVLEIGEGELKVWRRPASEGETNPSDYLPCMYCLGFILKKELWRHLKTCRLYNGDASPHRRLRYECGLLLAANRFPEGCSDELSTHVIPIMTPDNMIQSF